jgi:large subunit ribosomal protein L21
MYVIVDIAGQQYKVKKDQKIFVNRLEGKAGSKVDFNKVLLVDDDGRIKVGMPVVKNMVVSASIVSHLRGDKVKVFKKKRRKGYQVLNGHRQALTELLIESIGEGQAQTKAASKKEVETKSEAKQVTSGKAVATEKTVEKLAATAKPKPKPKKEPAITKAKPEAKKIKLTGEKKTNQTKAAAPARKSAATKAAPKAKKVTKKDSDK